MHALAHSRNFALFIERSDAKKKKKIVIRCDRGGKFSSTATARSTKTKKTDCVYRVFGKQGADGLWWFDRQDGVHNHGPCADIRVHSSARQLTEDQKQHRQRLAQAGVPPKAQLAVLRQEYDGFNAVQPDIHNETQRCRKQFLDGRSNIQALIDVLQQHGFFFRQALNAQGHITHLMFVHPSSITIAKAFHSVLLFDCTYKTNKFGLPLLVCTGLTPSNKSYFCCAAFMQQEGEEDYVWALRAVKSMLEPTTAPDIVVSDNEATLLNTKRVVFPNATRVICRWHVNRNIVKKCKREFPASSVAESASSDVEN